MIRSSPYGWQVPSALLAIGCTPPAPTAAPSATIVVADGSVTRDPSHGLDRTVVDPVVATDANAATVSDAMVVEPTPHRSPLEDVPAGWVRHIRKDGRATNWVEAQSGRCPEGWSLTHPYPGCGKRAPPPVCANKFLLCQEWVCSCAGKPISGCHDFREPWAYFAPGVMPDWNSGKPFPTKCTPLAVSPPTSIADAGASGHFFPPPPQTAGDGG